MDDVIVLEDFLTAKELQAVKDEIEILDFAGTIESTKANMNYTRYIIDAIFYANREDSSILDPIGYKLFSDETYNKFRHINSYALQNMRHTTRHETFVTIYKNNNQYDWHTDIGAGYNRVLNWIFYVDMGSKFTGGELEVDTTHVDLPYTATVTVKPEDNKMVIMPSHYRHRVLPIKMSSNRLFDGRVTVHGHIGYHK